MSSFKIGYINIYGQTGFSRSKVIELENVINCHKLDVVCLQETDVSQNTFSECNILRRFSPIINNSSTGYGTCTLVSNNLSIDNIIKDSDGRFISVDVDGSTIVNLYLPSGTDQNSKSKREDMIDSIPNLLLYKKQNGVCGGDFNSIVDKKDSLIHPDQKMSKCLSKLIKLYGLKDAFRALYPHSRQYSRYYIAKGVQGATRIDRCYVWGRLEVDEAVYIPVSFSDHLGHIVTFKTQTRCASENPRNRSIFKIKHNLVEDQIFLERIREAYPQWLKIKEGLSPTFWWENVFKKEIKSLAIFRQREINNQKCRELAALQLKLCYYLRKLKSSIYREQNVQWMTKYETAKQNLNAFYKDRANIILHQNRAEEFDRSDNTKIYHFESLDKYVEASTIKKVEVDGVIYEGQSNIEDAINKKLKLDLSQKFVLNKNVCDELFSFDVPQITREMDADMSKDISFSELKTALRQMRKAASPGLDGIPVTLYLRLIDLLAPQLIELFNSILRNEAPTRSMRTSTIQFLTKPKKKHSIKLEDKRKISVLCTDYKCLETILANRLTIAMGSFISSSQYASKPRKIHQGVAVARDVVNYACSKNVNMACVTLDMKSGFDLLQMDFVYYCLERYGFSKKSIEIFINMYSNALALTYINGKISKTIPDLRNTLRQGGCGSMQLFNIGVNPLVQLLECSLKGVSIYSMPRAGPVEEDQENIPALEQREKVVSYVDDIMPFITEENEFYILDECLKLFEKASGCRFHRDPESQKCTVMPLGNSWKNKMKNTCPLPYLQVTDRIDVLGISLHQTWTSTKSKNGDKLVNKISTIVGKWNSGRFYDLLLRPNIVNTYLFSNIWYYASVIDLKVADVNNIQSISNRYVHSNSALRPESIANYVDKKNGGLGVIHVKSKATALLIKNLIKEAEVNLYMNAVFRKYCEEEDLSSVPLKPPFLTDSLVSSIKYVITNVKQLNSKSIYKALLLKEFDRSIDFKLRAEERNNNFKENAVRVINSKIVSIDVRSYLWRLVHDISYLETDIMKIEKSNVKCRVCQVVNVEREHLLLTCDRLSGVGSALIKTLHVFNPRYTEGDVLMIDLDDDFPQVDWFVANALFYISKNRDNINKDKMLSYLQSTRETLIRSKYCDDNLRLSTQLTIELFENFM